MSAGFTGRGAPPARGARPRSAAVSVQFLPTRRSLLRDSVNPGVTTLRKFCTTIPIATGGPAEPLPGSRPALGPGPKPPRGAGGCAHAWGAAGAGCAAA